MKHRFELQVGEEILGEWVAGLPSRRGRTATYGGTLVRTDRRLIWEAVKLPAGLDRVAGNFLAELVSGVPLSSLRSVERDPDRPALIRVIGENGLRRFLVSASRMSPVWSKKNRLARDDAVARIAAAIGH